MPSVFRRASQWPTVLCSVVLLYGLVCGKAPADNAQEKSKEPEMGYLDNGHIRIGVNLDLGGAITYLSKSGSQENLINSFDWGRQIQMSHYSGPVPFAPNGKPPRKEWEGLGWNPIQSGDCYGNRSKVTAYRNDGKTLYVQCIPMQWPLDNEPGECTFECWIELEGDTAQVRSRLNNHRADTTQYPGRMQELPAVYTNGPWYRLMTYTGDKPFTEGACVQIPQVPPGSSFPWSEWQATENWAALLNEKGTGLGIWHPGICTFIGGFAGQPGAGGTKDSPTGYIAPIYEEILDHNIVYTFHYVLIPGSLKEIRRYVYAHSTRPAPPKYHFVTDRQHWHYVNAKDTGWPVRGELKVLLDWPDPQLIGPAGFWEAKAAPKLKIEAAFHTGPAHAIVYWKRADSSEFSEAKTVSFEVIPDGKYHTYTLDMAASPEYRGAITGLRFDPVPDGKSGESVQVRAIGF